jgi:hypothetical protein
VNSPSVLCVCLTSLTVGIFCAAQDLSFPKGWTAASFPGSTSGMSDDLRCANYSSNEWHVKVNAGVVQISRPPEPKGKGRTVEAKAGAGRLVGYDAGEFGGGLWWSGADGRKKIRLSNENVHAILARKNELLVFTGLAHGPIDEGKVYAYTSGLQSAGNLVELADLGTAPSAASIEDDGTVMIAATDRILAFNPSNHLRVLYQNRNMGALYTNSIATDPAGNVLVGMRFFVLRLHRRQGGEFTPEWYVPGSCTKTKLVGYDCKCIAREQ